MNNSTFSARQRPRIAGLRRMICLAALGWTACLQANPEGLTVARGTANAIAIGPQLNVQASHNAVLNWNTFNIKAGETTSFIQPTANSIVWNRINDINPSQIWGNLNANGYVVLYNQSGFYFGPNSVVNVGSGLVVSTAPVMPSDFTSGGLWQFNGAPPPASIINYGQIQTRSGGSLFLIADKVENHGTLTAPEGTIGLYAGKEVLLSERPDGRGLSAKVTLPTGSVDNQGRLTADGGLIALHAQVVNQDGLIQANSVRERNGVIELVASDRIALGNHSTISANGDASASSPGGQVRIQSGGEFTDSAASRISVQGGDLGGDGGTVTISAPLMSTLKSSLDGRAMESAHGAQLQVFPTDILLDAKGPGTGSLPTTLHYNVNADFVGFSEITLQATRDVSLAAGTLWDLGAATGISAPGSQLTLQAGRNILFGNNSQIIGGNGWSIHLLAGVNPNTPTVKTPGMGNIYFNGGPANENGAAPDGSGMLETKDGNIQLFAGNEIRLGKGAVRTTAGGSIDITTLAGDVDAGLRPDTYQYSASGYSASSLGIGGIGTAHGGDVTIAAGRDILSILPTIGAYDSGDVTLSAQRRIQGNFLLRQGTGIMSAGMDVGSSASAVSLALVTGHWEVNAAGDVYINEVRNPNGVFNNNRQVDGAKIMYQFDYALDASVSITAGNSVQLLGNNLPRTTSNKSMKAIYPPQLKLQAGAGGIILGNDVLLYPSPKGSLEVTTTAGGPLQSVAGQFQQIVMSDSEDPRYSTFETGHAASALHIKDGLGPVRFTIAGKVQNVKLVIPKATEIDIGGDALNFSFTGINLAPADRTFIHVQGDISWRGNRTVETLAADPNLFVFDTTYTANPSLALKLSYDPATRQFGFIGKMTKAERDFMLNPQVRAFDNAGLPMVDANGNPVWIPGSFTTDVAAINRLYDRSQDIPTSGMAFDGMQLSGPGAFEILANKLDLGTCRGIRSIGPSLNNSLNAALAAISPRGASIGITLVNDLDITASTIASFSGGDIALTAGGKMNVGTQLQFSGDTNPKGIYTTSGGDITVTAHDSININGSRIATYSGGNIAITSTMGDVNAGEGGMGTVSITRSLLNPATGKLVMNSTTIPGSGILATALPDTDAAVGNISVKAGRDILANKGGVIQLVYRETGIPSSITLDAGRDIEAKNSGIIGGNVVLNAGGNISGTVIATHDINIQTVANVNVTALAKGGVSVKGGTVSGSIVGGTSVSVTGSDSVTANLISQNVAGDTSGAKGVTSTTTARAETKVTTQATDAVATAKSDPEADDELKRKKAAAKPVLSRLTGRVTVILPK